MTPYSRIFLPALVALLLAMPGAAGADTARPAAYDATCTHFENRARFKTRGEDADLMVWLADSCRRALADLVGDAPDTARLGQTYLARLSEFKSLTLSMMLDMRRAQADHRIEARSQPIRRIGLTPAGEYLIARHMGLIGAYDDWANAAGFRLTERD